MFGTSGSLPEAICVRLCQGIFGGSIGVFRGSIRDITDPTNEATAYAILGFAWGMGAVVGPILGGVFESPAKNYPNWAIGKVQVFKDYPYLLPTALAGGILAIGALLATRLSWDGGPRRSKIALPVDKDDDDIYPEHVADQDVENGTTPGASTLRHKASSIWSPGHHAESPAAIRASATAENQDDVLKEDEALLERDRHIRGRGASFGTAYGYGGIRIKREEMAARALAARRESQGATYADGTLQSGDVGDRDRGLTLARKFLLANEENTFNLNELWVSAATAADENAVFEDDDEDEEGEYAEGEESRNDDDDGEDDSLANDSRFGTPTRGDRRAPSFSTHTDRANSPYLDIPGDSGATSSGHLSPAAAQNARKPRLGGLTSGAGDGSIGRSGTVRPPSSSFGLHHRVSVSGRKFSSASGHLPAIYANTGLNTPPAIAAAYEPTDYLSETPHHHREATPGLTAIQEGSASKKARAPGSPTSSEAGTIVLREIDQTDSATITRVEPSPSTFKSLPLLIILQYGLLAFHDTIHGQIFMSFLVS